MNFVFRIVLAAYLTLFLASLPSRANFSMFAFNRASTAAVCSAAVATNGLQSVCNLKITSNVGPRRSPTLVAGVDTLPAACSIISAGGENYVLCTGNATFGTSNSSASGWDFSAMGGVIVRGNTTVVDIWDSLWIAGTCGARTNTYGLQVSDNSTTPTVNLHYSKFDGGKCNTAVSTAGPWSGAAVFVLTGATLISDHIWYTGIGYDVHKCSNATFKQDSSYIQAYGWNQNADADAPQLISCNANLGCTSGGNFWDISDGAALAQAHNFPGVPANSLIFNTIDTGSTQNSTQSFCNNIAYGYGLYGTTCCTNFLSAANGLPFNVLSVCDNHTNIGGGWTLSGTWTNNVIQKANTDYTTHGGTLTSAACIAAWSTNLDYDIGTTITAPSF